MISPIILSFSLAREASWLGVRYDELCSPETWDVILSDSFGVGVAEAEMFDHDKMFFFDPSWNTDQGVWHICEYLSEKLGAQRKQLMRSNEQHPPDMILREKVLSVSIYVGTRKMVNYAWIGWSQGKLWWKLEAILTCKSIVKFGHRGERLIEPSSSWFPLKFPSG